jgi:hypothetical protein
MHTPPIRLSRTLTQVLAALMITLWFSGCASLNAALNEVRFDVETSALDYVTMACHIPQEPDRSAWLQLSGSGLLEVRRGSSKRVGDDMWHSPDQANWDDYRSNRIALSKPQTEDAFQWLVDAGFFDRDLKNSASTNEVYFAMVAQVGFKKQRAIVSGDAYTALFTTLYRTGTR